MGKDPTYRFLDEMGTRSSLLAWFESLKKKRGDRARLRRAESPDDVLLCEPFFNFLQRMPADWADEKNMLQSAMVAAVLAHVEEHRDGKTFAQQLAAPKKGDKPSMSELRFQRLQKSRDTGEFYRRLLSAVRLSGKSVNILSLADSILHWMHEYRNGVEREPGKRLAVCWANDYYLVLPKS